MEELSDLEADPDEPGPRTLQPFQQQSQANPTAAPADQTLQGRIQNWQYKVDRVVLDDDRVLWNNGGAGTGRDVYNNRPSNVPMLSKGLFQSMISIQCTTVLPLYLPACLLLACERMYRFAAVVVLSMSGKRKRTAPYHA
jgi:hypothetical protein